MKKRKSTSTKLYRQGDVLFQLIACLPQGKRVKRENGVVAYGEMAGHSHALAIEDREHAEVLEIGGDLFVHVMQNAMRGGTIPLPGATFTHQSMARSFAGRRLSGDHPTRVSAGLHQKRDRLSFTDEPDHHINL